ncbi:hypothetical protein EDD15DRAFT_2193948 [Pisolithus albus]|nr:hypothetical protein EDD15DRAFT_2201015 [Pisolithus albus]KAI5999286.1 hypothetical protein EDD15DRAFT_2193948 [Pisolithus albus]
MVERGRTLCTDASVAIFHTVFTITNRLLKIDRNRIMVKSTQKPRVHRPMLWRMEGGSGVRHAKSERIHPNCTPECPGHFGLNVNAPRNKRTRQPTRDEIISGLQMGPASDELARCNLLPMTQEEIGNAGSTSLDMVMDEDESMNMDVDNGDGQSSHGFQQASAEAGPSMLSNRLSSPMTRSTGPSPRQSRLTTPIISRSASVNRDDWYPIEESETRSFNILYVPDPSRAVSRREAESDLAWATREITFRQFDAIKDLTGFVYKQRENKTGVKVRVTEWLWFILQMDDYDKGEAFKIDFMPWDTFRDIVLNPKADPTAWNGLASKDGIIGGIDYSIDYRSDQNAYGLDKGRLARYEVNIKALAFLTQLWPPIEQIRSAGKKWPTTCHLQMIAQLKGNYSPFTSQLEDGADIQEDTVLKRSNSDCGKHIILPSVASKYRTWNHLRSCINDDEIWMAQEYVETLGTIGEWRAFVIGGRIMSVVHTHKRSDGMWTGVQTESFLKTEEIKELIEHAPKPINAAELRKNIVNPQSGTILVRDDGKSQFRNFVLDTWRDLVLRETRLGGAKSSLAVFCRMDIGLKFLPEGPPQYFVNEVERSPTTSLWFSCNPSNTMGTMADTFAMVFRQWIKDIRNPYVL